MAGTGGSPELPLAHDAIGDHDEECCVPGLAPEEEAELLRIAQAVSAAPGAEAPRSAERFASLVRDTGGVLRTCLGR